MSKPKINAVPLNQKWPENLKTVVFCKDCSKFVVDHERNIIYCGAWGGLNGNGYYDYCSYGKPRSEDDDWGIVYG